MDQPMKILSVVAILFVLWILSMHFYLPLPVIVILYATLVSVTTLALWRAWMHRWDRTKGVVNQDTKS